MIQWFPVEHYSMKCRLYPTKKQAEKIDTWIRALHAVHNMILYDMRENGMYAKEVIDKEDHTKVAHFPDFAEAFKAINLKKYREENPIINLVPGGAISSINCGLNKDMRNAWVKTGRHPIEQWGFKYVNKQGQKITKGIGYYSQKKPRRSFAYQFTTSNICQTDNPNTLLIRLASKNDEIGCVKIRGWNQKLRFDDEHQVGFAEWATSESRIITIRMTKDVCGDYWIVFMLPLVYKPVEVPESRKDVIGIDVGEITLATLSDATKIQNIFDHNPRVLDEKATLAFYHRKLSRSQGWMNPKFRSSGSTEPSNTYKYYLNKLQKLERKIQRQRKDYYNQVTAMLSVSADCIGIEGLKISDMYHRK